MILRIYALVVSLAAVIGLLLSVVPFVHGVLEYRSPELVEPRQELASLENFVLAKSRMGDPEDALKGRRYGQFAVVNFWERDQWQATYEAAKSQYVESVKRKAARDCIAYGSLFALCIALLITHLLWARRI